MAKTWTVEEVRNLGVHTGIRTASSILGMGDVKGYNLAKREEFPVPILRVGRKYVVPVSGLLKALGIEAPDNGAPAA